MFISLFAQNNWKNFTIYAKWNCRGHSALYPNTEHSYMLNNIHT